MTSEQIRFLETERFLKKMNQRDGMDDTGVDSGGGGLCTLGDLGHFSEEGLFELRPKQHERERASRGWKGEVLQEPLLQEMETKLVWQTTVACEDKEGTRGQHSV